MNYIHKDENALFYECGYSCDNGYLACLGGEKFFITDGRYTIEAKNSVNKGVVVIDSANLIKDLRMIIRASGVSEIYLNPDEFSLNEWQNISQNLNINFKFRPSLSHLKRIIKNENELEILRSAARLGAQKFDEFAKFLNENGEGLSEKELFFQAELIFKDSGNLGLSFAPIVAINENSAKAHALPTDKRLKKGDLILLDAGVRYKGFCSDRTRTAVFDEGLKFDKNQKFTSQKQNEIYEIVKEAQSLAIRAVAPGVKAHEIDAAARNFIAKMGYAKEFFHSTGHGVGLDIHELPYISPRSDFVVEKGMVFSIEPGIYLENEFGVRIEDVVIVTDEGCEILSEY